MTDASHELTFFIIFFFCIHLLFLSFVEHRCFFDQLIRNDMRKAMVVNERVGKGCSVRIDFENGLSGI